MFTVVYEKEDGKVMNIVGATYTEEDFLQAYGDKMDKLEVEQLPYVAPYRQYLAVKDKELIVVTEELTPQKEKFVKQTEIADEINALKNYLKETDYTVIKCSELELNYTEAYPEISTERTKARARINELEEELQSLEDTLN